MAREIPLAKRLQVVRLYFEGLHYEDISKKTGVSKGSVAAVVEELRQGRFPELEDAVDLLSEIRELAAGLRKVSMSPVEATGLFVLAKRLMGLGVEPAHLELWTRMCRSVAEEEFPRSAIIQAATKLTKLEQEGLSYEEALSRLEQASAEVKQLQANVDALEKERSRLEEAKASLTKECQALAGERDRVEAERRRADEGLMSLQARSQGLAKQVGEREATLSRAERRHHELSVTLPRLEEGVAKRSETLAAIEGLGFNRDQLEKLRASLSDIAQRHGQEEVTTRFLECLRTYEAVLALEARKDALAAEVDRLARQKESLAKLGERFGLPPDEVAEDMAAMKALVRKGVSPASVASYHRLLSSAGVQPQSFEKMVEELGGVAAALKAKQGELADIEQELAAKGQALEELRGQEASVKESIATLKDAAVKQVQDLASSAAAEVEKLCQGLQQDIVKWGQVRAEMAKREEELRLARYFTTIPLTDGALSSLVEEISTAIVIQYLTVALAWCRNKLNPRLRPPRTIWRKYYTISEYSEVELADVITWALLTLTEGMGGAKP